jgi:SSS family transporter
MHSVDYVVVLVYLLLMIVIGFSTRSSSKNVSDYIRMGNKSTWWMAGLSLFMSSFSAATFTGIAGQAFIAGWSVLFVPLSSAFVFFIQAAFMARIFRRTRAITPMDAVRARFGPAAEMVKAYVGLLSAFFFAGFFLLGFSTFASALLGIPFYWIVVGMGFVVVFYSVAGGAWSVQITDSLQALILIPGTIAVALLALYQVGGIDGLLQGIRDAGLSRDFAFLKYPGHEYETELAVREGNFTPLWLIGVGIGGVIIAVNISSCYRYLSLQDEKSSQKAALLAGTLTLFGSIIWILPSMAGRLLFLDDVVAVRGIPNPADAAYAVTAMKVVPPGLLGLIVVFMLAATMSSMDTFLTGTAGFVVRNIYQPILRFLKRGEPTDRALLKITRYVNLGLGLWAIVMAFVLNRMGGDTGMFEVMQTVITLVAGPTGLPFALSLFLRRIPLWGLFAGIGCGMIVSITLFVMRAQGHKVEWGYETMIMSAACILPTIFSTLFWNRASPRFREHVNAFFELINRPVSVKEEVGATVDSELLKTVGSYALMTGLLVFVLGFWSESIPQLVAILGIGSFLLTIGGLMFVVSRRKGRTTG